MCKYFPISDGFFAISSFAIIKEIPSELKLKCRWAQMPLSLAGLFERWLRQIIVSEAYLYRLWARARVLVI